MITKVSLGGLNHRSTWKIKQEITETANGNIESMDEYVRLIRLVRQSFSRKQSRIPVQTREEL